MHIYDGLGIIRNETFDGLESCNITELVIRALNDLHDLESMSFAKLHRLETLDLVYKQKLGFETLSKSWIGLANTSISTLILTRTVSDDQQMNEWTNSCYRHLERTRICSLSLDKNNIVFIDEGLHKHLPNLEYLNLACNRLSDVLTIIQDIAQLKEVRMIDVRHEMKRFMRRRSYDNVDEKMSCCVTENSRGFERRREILRRLQSCKYYTVKIHGRMEFIKAYTDAADRTMVCSHHAKTGSSQSHRVRQCPNVRSALIYIFGPSKTSDVLYAGYGITKLPAQL